MDVSLFSGSIFLMKELKESSSAGFHGSSAQPQVSSFSVAPVMELLWVLKASLGFPLRRPQEMSVAGRAPERHSSLGCAGGTPPDAWQPPGSWGLNEKLNTSPLCLARGALAPFLTFQVYRLRGREAQEPALLLGGGSSSWSQPRSSGAAPGEGESGGGHCLTLDLAVLG